MTMTRTPLIALCLAVFAAACDDPSGVRVGPPANLEVISGNAQTGAAGTELPDPLVVKVTDERGHAVKGQLVNFRVTAGGGTVFASASITNNDGIAQERWTLGTAAGSTQTVEARAIDNDTGAPLVFATFTATVTASAPTQVRAAPAAGDTLRAGVAGSQANDSLRVLVRDQYGNPVPGASVQWTAATGGGAITPAGTTTGPDGIARAGWTLGNTTGVTQNAEAFVAGAGTVRFVARVATTMTRFAGDGQTAAVGSPITVSVRLTDSAGQGVGGIPVTWQVMSGGGSVAATSASGGLDGVASVQWTLGMTPGVQVLNATAGTLNLAFTANAQPSATRTLVTQVPGTVLDVDGTRVLWMDGTALKVRSRSGGGDVTILADSSASGRLFPGGVIAVRGTNPYTVYQYVSGTPTAIGTAANGNPHDVDETYAVQGSWAAWRQHPTGPVLRRNLA
ncbi:MAG TPA: Ig-like domain-containing protein, partial [Longimicrobium sp.]|nr:Ig-like domain-containing protein [Longimicrobium sp.]